MVQNEFSIGYCPDIVCYEPLLVRNVDLIDEKGCSQIRYVSCHACGKTFRIENIIDLKLLTSNGMRGKLLAENLLYRIKTLPSRSNYPEFVRLNGISPFLYKLAANLLTEFGFGGDRVVRPLKFLQAGCSVFCAENLSRYSYTIDDKFLLTRGIGMASNRTLSHLYNMLDFVNLYNENCSILHCLDTGASGTSNGFLFSVSKSMIGNELLWRLLQERCYEHYMESEQTYEKEFGVLEKDLKELDMMSAAKFCPLQGKFKQIYAFLMANLLSRTIIIMGALTNVEDVFCTVFLPLLCSPEECIDKLSGVFFPPIVLSYINEERDHLSPLIFVEGVITRLPKDFLDNAYIYGIGDRGFVELYFNNDGESYVFSTGKEIQNPHELVESLDHAFLQRCEVSLHIISDYFEDILEKIEYTDEIWSTLRDTIEDISKANLWRCLVCWRLSITPTVEQCDLCPGGFVYERIMKDNVWYIFDGVDYRDEIFGIFIYDALNDRFQLHGSEISKCLHCRRRMFQLRRQITNCHIEYKNGDHTWEPSFKSTCIRRKKHIWNGRSHDNNPILITITFEYSMNENSKTVEIWWFKDEDVPDYRAHLEREMKALKHTYKIHSLLRNKIKAFLLKCIEDGMMDVECSSELWNMNQKEMSIDNGETIIFSSSSDKKMVEKCYGFKIIEPDNESPILSSEDSTGKTSSNRRRKPKKDTRKKLTKSELPSH